MSGNLSSARSGPDPRRSALQVLNILDKGRKTLDRILDEIQTNDPAFSRRDRSLFYALTYGVLRWRGRLDWIIGHFSRPPIRRIDPKVLNILRLALFQIVFLDKIPDSAAVNTAVEMAKSVAPAWVVRYVNGVLRNAARGYRDIPYPDMDRDPATALAVIHSFPEWLMAKWLHRFGIETTVALCRATNTIPPVTLRVNTLKASREALIKAIGNQVEQTHPTHYTPDGVTLSGLRTAIPHMAEFRKGLFQVQDEAAQLVTLFLNPQPGETVLDACAGLGGKTGHMAQLMRNRGRIIALDSNNRKLSRLDAEMKRLGVSTVETRRVDLSLPPRRLPLSRFDRVLLDAPCSGLGVLRRNPDTKWRIKKTDLKISGQRQALFMENLSRLVKPSGVLVYAVCSMEPEENEAVVKDFLNNHPEFVMDIRGSGLPPGAEAALDERGFLKTFPHRHGMDGFFAARLKRIK